VVDTKGEDISFENMLLEHPIVEEVEEAEQGQYKEDYHLWEFTLNINPYYTEAVDNIADFKEDTSVLLDEAGIEEADQQFWLAGETATLYDTDQVTKRDQNIIIPVLLTVIALLLFIYLR